jgi:dTDP-glucose pyrophosphorylase
MHIEYRVEDQPLGTAGGVKNCADFWAEDDFLVISGDAACDFDLQALMARHRESGSAATIALSRQAVPLRYGLAVTDGENRVRSFVEKPVWQRVVTDLVNTGIYVLSPRAMDYVPRGRPYDFAKDLFPLLLERGETVLGLPMEGYWCDVGTPLSYYQCCVDALEGRLKLDVPEAFRPRAGTPGHRRPPEETAAAAEVACRDRAAAMGALSSLMLEMGADFTDGIRVPLPAGEVHIRPRADRSAISVSVRAPDAEFAASLALSAGEIIRALNL